MDRNVRGTILWLIPCAEGERHKKGPLGCWVHLWFQTFWVLSLGHSIHSHGWKPKPVTGNPVLPQDTRHSSAPAIGHQHLCRLPVSAFSILPAQLSIPLPRPILPWGGRLLSSFHLTQGALHPVLLDKPGPEMNEGLWFTNPLTGSLTWVQPALRPESAPHLQPPYGNMSALHEFILGIPVWTGWPEAWSLVPKFLFWYLSAPLCPSPSTPVFKSSLVGFPDSTSPSWGRRLPRWSPWTLPPSLPVSHTLMRFPPVSQEWPQQTAAEVRMGVTSETLVFYS